MKKGFLVITAMFLLAGCAKPGTPSVPSSSGGQGEGLVPEDKDAGMPLLVKEEYSDPSMNYTREFTYDSDGNVMTEEYKSSTEEYTKIENTYVNGKLTHSDVQSAGGYIEGNYTTDYEYNDDGSYVMTNTYESGSVKEVYTYDVYGNLIKLVSAYDGGEYVQENATEVNSEGQPLHVTSTANGEVMNEVFYEYGENGEVVLTKTVSNAGPGMGEIIHEVRYEYELDSNRNTAKRVQFDIADPENTRTVTVYQYNDHGQCISETTTDPAGNVSSLTRTYR